MRVYAGVCVCEVYVSVMCIVTVVAGCLCTGVHLCMHHVVFASCHVCLCSCVLYHSVCVCCKYACVQLRLHVVFMSVVSVCLCIHVLCNV